MLPGVHRVASLLKRWLLGTHQGSVEPAHLPAGDSGRMPHRDRQPAFLAAPLTRTADRLETIRQAYAAIGTYEAARGCASGGG